MFCKNCGNELAEGSKFCGTCGAKTEVDIPFTEETTPGTSRLETFDREDDKEKKPAKIEMDWSTPGEKKAKPYSSGVTFDWSSVADEPRKKPVANIRSPWDTTGIDDDEVDMMDRAFSPAKNNGALENVVFRDAQGSPAPEHSRTLTFIDIVKARQQEEQAAHNVDNEFKADFGTANKPFGATEDFDFRLSEAILPEREREHTQGYTDLNNDIVAALENHGNAQPQARDRYNTGTILERDNPLEYTPNFEEQLEYIRARRDSQNGNQPAQYTAPQQARGGDIFNFEEPVPQRDMRPQVINPVFENQAFEGPAFTAPAVEYTVPAREAVRPAVRPQDQQTLSLEEELASILGTNSAFEGEQQRFAGRQQPVVQQPAAYQPVAQQPAAYQPVAQQPAAYQPVAQQPVAYQPVAQQPAAYQPVAQQPAAYQPVAQQPVAYQPVAQQPVAPQPVAQQPVVQQPVAQRVMPQAEEEMLFDIEDEYLNFAPSRRAARYGAANDEMVAAGLASEVIRDTGETVKATPTKSITSEIKALQAQLDALKGKNGLEVEREPVFKEDPEIRRFDEEFTVDLQVPVDDDDEYQNDAFEDFDIDEILGKREKIELDFSDEPLEIPDEWREREFSLGEVSDFGETQKFAGLAGLNEAPKFDEAKRFDDTDDPDIEGELAALGFDVPAAKTPVTPAAAAADDTSTARLFQETGAKFESLEKLINQELASLGLENQAGAAIPPDDEMLFSDEAGDMLMNFDEKPLSFDDIEQPEMLETSYTTPSEPVMTLDELEENIFADSTFDEDIEATRKIEKFFTLYRKNEEFQSLLDQEYEKLRGGADVATMLEAVDAYERGTKINGIPPAEVPPVTTGNIRANIERERAEFNARQEALQAQAAAASRAAAQAPAVNQVIAPPEVVEEEPEQPPVKEKGGALTVIAVIVAILLASLFIIILILNFAPDSIVAIKVSEWIGKFASIGAVPGIEEWLV